MEELYMIHIPADKEPVYVINCDHVKSMTLASLQTLVGGVH